MRKIARILFTLGLAAGVAFAATGCKKTEKSAGRTLYERLGGAPAITAVVGGMVDNIAADTRINHFFVDTDLAVLKTNFGNLIGQVTGGPERYTGRDMKTTHGEMGIAEGDFAALIEDLTRSLEAHQVPAKERGELLDLLGSMKGDIVTK
jgi:hemoglobin